jgi:hypothetical protein
MAKFHVHARRTEDITFEVEASSEEDAIARYLMDGDEIASELLEPGPEVIDVEKVRA